ncbi:MAG: ATP-dependent protease subunit HslV [Candidatus Zixiibacteriota bacterium]|nr:MAG: ATP-dependent protease subunit HslV [candidate division Zixibacteria bacterium]
MHATTILGLIHNGKAAIAGDGQVTMDDMVVKSGAVKIRPMYDGKVLSGFAGTAGDALALFDLFEKKLDEFSGNLQRASVEMVKEWRTEKTLQQLEALIVVTDGKRIFVISGNGDVVEPDDGIAAIGSGGPYALAAARAMVLANPKMSAEKIAGKALEIAANICIYTNNNIKVQTLG